jgi:hypothetical protein
MGFKLLNCKFVRQFSGFLSLANLENTPDCAHEYCHAVCVTIDGVWIDDSIY